MMHVIISIILSLSYCLFVTIADTYLGTIIKTHLSSFNIVAFLVLGVLSGSAAAFIISRYKNFNFIASIILPTLLTLFNLYLSLFLPILLGAFHMIDYGLTTLYIISIVNLFMFLRDRF